ncbi:MAG TPA: hypothetical protein VG826_29230 [Pirellulales bacterium]|nr:hypothetical protein [Pirellulales bacterium]
MAQQRYSIYPASLTSTGPVTTNLQQIHGVSIKPDSRKDEIIPGGAIDRAAVILQGAAPVVSFKTHDLATIFGVLSPSAGLVCAAGTNLIQYQKRADGGTFASGSSHVVLTNKKGFLVPKRLSASQDRPVELELDLWCLWDGSTSGTPAVAVPPLTIATASALTSTPAFESEYYMGPVYANSVQLPAVSNWEIDFGIDYQAKAFDGDLWPQTGTIISRKPKITVTSTDDSQAGTIGSFFNAALPGTLALYCRIGVAGASRSSDASTVHAKFSVTTGAWNVSSLDGDGQDDAMLKADIEPTSTLAVSMASAIP